jgi:hypothetical protein
VNLRHNTLLLRCVYSVQWLSTTNVPRDFALALAWPETRVLFPSFQLVASVVVWLSRVVSIFFSVAIRGISYFIFMWHILYYKLLRRVLTKRNTLGIIPDEIKQWINKTVFGSYYFGRLAFLRRNIIGSGAHKQQQRIQIPPTMWKHIEKLAVNTWM